MKKKLIPFRELPTELYTHFILRISLISFISITFFIITAVKGFPAELLGLTLLAGVFLIYEISELYMVRAGNYSFVEGTCARIITPAEKSFLGLTTYGKCSAYINVNDIEVEIPVKRQDSLSEGTVVRIYHQPKDVVPTGENSVSIPSPLLVVKVKSNRQTD